MKRKYVVPPGTPAADAWSAAGLAAPAANTDARASSPKEARHDCQCGCPCGATATESQPKCWTCTQGIHHRCSRACRPYEPATVKWGGVTMSTKYIPARRPCNGARSGR